MESKTILTSREVCILDITSKLKNTDHAILKEFNGIKSVVHTHSDIDMVMSKADTEKFILNISRKNVVSENVKRKSFMLTLELYFSDNSFLSIDFIHAFKRKSAFYMNAEQVLDKAFTGKDGLKYASPHCNAEYILLFYSLNNAAIPKKYLSSFKSFPPLVYSNLSEYLKNKYDVTLDEILSKKELIKLDIKEAVNQGKKDFKQPNAFMQKWLYFKDTFLRVFLGIKAPIISLSGVDGAGKTTILYKFKELLETKYRKTVVVIRHRPSVLPILSAYVHGKEKASEISMSKLPRQGTNKNVLSSLIRFTYYYLDYIIGQVFISFKYSRRGIVVLYDRYYYDFILDGIRSNISLPEWLVKSLFIFVKKPELNFFLWASPEVILSRKKEMQSEDIIELTEKYKGLFISFEKKYPSYFKNIENIEIDSTLNEIEDSYVNKIKRS